MRSTRDLGGGGWTERMRSAWGSSVLASLPFVTFQYSYGGGLRFKLSRALVARVDVGFSEEEVGHVYLSFGQTF